jgi:hypothetical protein
MELAERQERWQAMWQVLQRCSPVLWGGNFLGALTQATAAQSDRVHALRSVG